MKEYRVNELEAYVLNQNNDRIVCYLQELFKHFCGLQDASKSFFSRHRYHKIFGYLVINNNE